MPNVWDAMKKHQAEEPTPEAGPPTASAPESAPPPAPSTAPGPRARPLALASAVSPNGYAPMLIAHHDRGSMVTEEYRQLRTNLLARYPNEQFCLLVTSATEGEGKTVTCLNLAFVLAERLERTTVVVDCDLRKRIIANLMHVPNSPGMAELLRGQVTLEQAVQRTAYPNLFVVPAGQAKQHEVGEILGRPVLEDIVRELRQRYDHVLCDTPPIGIADAGIIGRMTREAILVVRMNKTHRESVKRAIGLLHSASVKPVGLVLTHQKLYIPGYLYRYS